MNIEYRNLSYNSSSQEINCELYHPKNKWISYTFSISDNSLNNIQLLNKIIENGHVFYDADSNPIEWSSILDA